MSIVLGACTGSSTEAIPRRSPSPTPLSLDEYSDRAIDLCAPMVAGYRGVATERNITKISAKFAEFRGAVKSFTRKFGRLNLQPQLEESSNHYMEVLHRVVEALRNALVRRHRKAPDFVRSFEHLGDAELKLVIAYKVAQLPVECVVADDQQAYTYQFIGRALGDCVRTTKQLNKEAPDGIPSTPSEGIQLYGVVAEAYHSLAKDLREDAPPQLGTTTKIRRLADLSDQIGAAFDRGASAIGALNLGAIEAALDDAEDLAAKARKLSKDLNIADCSGAFFT